MLRPLVDQRFGAWKAAGPAAPPFPTRVAPQPGKRQIFIVDKPGAAQSQIRIGLVGVPRSTPDYVALDVWNTILGGSFTSRLNNNLREKHGYAYGAVVALRHAHGRPGRSRPAPACRPTRPPRR